MAKGNALLGTLRGSTGDVTFRVSNGKQVMSRKATTVKNPRTSKQIYQRMFFATISKARSAMKKIVDHSFENVQHGMKSLSYFQARNVALLRQNARFNGRLQAWVSPGMSFVTPDWTSFAPNPYRISEGSLSVVNDIAPMISIINADAPEDFPDDYIAQTFPWFQNFTPAEWVLEQLFSDALSYENVMPGDFMTAVFVTAKKDDINSGAGVEYPCSFHYVRFKAVDLWNYGGNFSMGVVLIASNIDGANYDIPNKINGKKSEFNFDKFFIKNGSTSYPYINFSDSDVFSASIVIDNDPEVAGEPDIDMNNTPAPIGDDDIIIAGTWIHSRPTVDKLLVSTQDLILADPTGDVLDLNLGLNDAYDIWRENTKQVGNDTLILEGGNK